MHSSFEFQNRNTKLTWPHVSRMHFSLMVFCHLALLIRKYLYTPHLSQTILGIVQNSLHLLNMTLTSLIIKQRHLSKPKYSHLWQARTLGTRRNCSRKSLSLSAQYWNRFKIPEFHRYHKSFQIFISYKLCTCQSWNAALKCFLPSVQWKTHWRRTENIFTSLIPPENPQLTLATSGPRRMVSIADLTSN